MNEAVGGIIDEVGHLFACVVAENVTFLLPVVISHNHAPPLSLVLCCPLLFPGFKFTVTLKPAMQPLRLESRTLIAIAIAEYTTDSSPCKPRRRMTWACRFPHPPPVAVQNRLSSFYYYFPLELFPSTMFASTDNFSHTLIDIGTTGAGH